MAMAASPAASRPATPDLRHGGSVIGGRRAGRGVLGHRARRTDRTARPSDRAVGARRGDRRGDRPAPRKPARSEEHTSELQSLMRISYAVFCLKKKKKKEPKNTTQHIMTKIQTTYKQNKTTH